MKTPNWVVKDVKPNSDYTLHITFADGAKKIFDAHPLLKKPIYQKLNNLAFFLSARAECGTVIWDDETDIAPEYLYESSYTAE